MVAAAQPITASVLRPPVLAVPRIWRTDHLRTRLEPLTPALPYVLEVTCNPAAAYSRVAKIGVVNPDALRPLVDYVYAELELTGAGGDGYTVPLGHYLCTPSAVAWDGRKLAGTIAGYDGTLALEQSTLECALALPVGSNAVRFVWEVLGQAGIPLSMVRITDAGVLTTTEHRWPAGTGRRTVANDVLGAIGMYHLWTDGEGLYRSMPYRDLPTAKPVATFGSEAGQARIVPPVREQPDWLRLANRVTVRKVVPNQEPIVAQASVTDPSSPVHPERLAELRGAPRPVVLGHTVDDPTVETEAAAQALAERVLAERASYYRPGAVETIVDLHPDAHQIIELDVRDGTVPVYAGRWWRWAWTLRLDGPVATLDAEINMTVRVA